MWERVSRLMIFLAPNSVNIMPSNNHNVPHCQIQNNYFASSKHAIKTKEQRDRIHQCALKSFIETLWDETWYPCEFLDCPRLHGPHTDEPISKEDKVYTCTYDIVWNCSHCKWMSVVGNTFNVLRDMNLMCVSNTRVYLKHAVYFRMLFD